MQCSNSSASKFFRSSKLEHCVWNHRWQRSRGVYFTIDTRTGALEVGAISSTQLHNPRICDSYYDWRELTLAAPFLGAVCDCMTRLGTYRENCEYLYFQGWLSDDLSSPVVCKGLALPIFKKNTSPTPLLDMRRSCTTGLMTLVFIASIGFLTLATSTFHMLP